jgi:hypothetical protein
VALTSASTPTGYVVDVSNQAPGHSAWEAFDNDADGSNADHRWRTDDNRYTNNSSTGTPSSPTGAASTYLFTGSEAGDWISVEFPEKMKIVYYTITGIHRHTPYEGVIYGYDTVMTTWERVSSFINPIVHPGDNRPLESPQFHKDESNTKYYSKYAMIVVKTNGHHAPSMYEWKLYGVQEYDSEAHGTDVTVKSVANVPNTDWLEVYYDAKDLGNGAVTNPISGLGGTTNNGTAYGDTQISDGAFVFDGNGDYIETTVTTETGNWPHSYSFWMKADTDASSGAHFVALGTEGGAGSGTSVIRFSNDEFLWYFWSNDVYFKSSNLRGRWVHVVGTYDGGSVATSRKIFINNVEVPIRSTAGTIGSLNLTTTSTPFKIGSKLDNTNTFKGSIANVRLFNRALTTDEIHQLYAYQKEYFGHGNLGMTLKAGRLGIGTSEPRAMLDVRGDFYASGSVVQIQTNVYTAVATTSDTTWKDISSSFGVTITPKFANSNFLIQAMIHQGGDNSGDGRFTFYRIGRYVNDTLTEVGNGDTGNTSGIGTVCTAAHNWGAGGALAAQTYDLAIANVNIVYVDQPNTTSPITYRIRWNSNPGGTGTRTAYINRVDAHNDNYRPNTISTLVITEIAQ